MSADSPEVLKRFSEKHNLEYPLLSDREKIAIKRLEAWGKKKLYGKEYEGIIRSTVVLEKNKTISYRFPKVSPAEHAEEVLDVLGIK